MTLSRGGAKEMRLSWCHQAPVLFPPFFYNRNIRKKRKREKSGCLIATRLSKVIDDVFYRPYTRLYTSVQQRINGAVRGYCSDVQQGAALYSRCIVATQPERKLYIYLNWYVGYKRDGH
jgi:hypothetical protein